MKRFRTVLIALLTAALLMLQTAAALGAQPQETGSFAKGPRPPAPLSFPSDPGVPDPVP